MKALLSTPEALGLYRANACVFVDTRSEQEFQQGHIPGAVNISLMFTYLLTEENGGLTRLVDTFSDTLSATGIATKNTVVLYENNLSNCFGKSCRGHFIMKLLGHEEVMVLEGGYDDWVSANGPTTKAPSTRPRSVYHALVDPRSLARKEHVLEALTRKSAVLVDCRDEEEWSAQSSSPYGKDYCPRKGRIPGAVWLSWRRVLKNTGTGGFLAPAQIREVCADVGLDLDADVIIYCFKGSRAAAMFVALGAAGFSKVRNYFGSWNEWSRDLDLPVDVSPTNKTVVQHVL
jgi:thiosulfate/3-mercaptopyruvate sulfurtransferase